MAVADESMNHFEYGFGFGEDLEIVESEHGEALGLKKSSAFVVALQCVQFEMLSTIDFNHQLHRWRVKVNDVRTDRTLAKELYAEKLLSPDGLPQLRFRLGHIGTE